MTTKKKKRQPSEQAAIDALKEEPLEERKREHIVVNNDGIKLILKPVPPALVQDVQLRIKDPEVPMWYNEVKDRDEPNPVDPSYLAGLDDARRQRVAAVVDACVAFGVEFAEEGTKVPKSFFKKLDRAGIEYDAGDKEEIQFLYSKYSLTADELVLLMRVAGVEIEGEADRFGELFPS